MTKPHNAADEKAVEEKRDLVEIEAQQEQADLKYLMNLPQGQRFFHRFFEKAHLFETVFNKHSSLMAMLEGERNVGLRLLSEMEDADAGAVPAILINFKKEQ